MTTSVDTTLTNPTTSTGIPLTVGTNISLRNLHLIVKNRKSHSKVSAQTNLDYTNSDVAVAISYDQ